MGLRKKKKKKNHHNFVSRRQSRIMFYYVLFIARYNIVIFYFERQTFGVVCVVRYDFIRYYLCIFIRTPTTKVKSAPKLSCARLLSVGRCFRRCFFAAARTRLSFFFLIQSSLELSMFSHYMNAPRPLGPLLLSFTVVRSRRENAPTYAFSDSPGFFFVHNNTQAYAVQIQLNATYLLFTLKCGDNAIYRSNKQ